MVRQWHGSRRNLTQQPAIADRVVLPTQHAHDVVTLRNALKLTGYHLSDHPGLQYFTYLKRRNVRPDVIHTPAHVRVYRHENIAHHNLSVGRIRNGLLA